MILKINHISTYSYDKAIFLEPHHLYFHPQTRPYYKVVDFKLAVLPNPSGQSARIDIESNAYTQCWFNDLVEELRVEVDMVIDTKPFNQFGYFLEEQPKTVFQEIITQYAKPQTLLSKDLINFVEGIFKPNDTNFLANLCTEVNAKCKHITSEEDQLMPPNECFQTQEGSCRDLAWLMMELLRHKEIPARFVSGYSFNPEITGHELHAWVEAWMPGAGWIALDPSTGLFITETYIPIACSYHPTNTLPIQGLYRGNASSKLSTSVSIQGK